ncbi:hypothetical protein ACQ4M3_28910 [Leptolyngbya sp. AN03gr2]|uniref:hypothetical protein n=1 Tax=unclassified Leptolyngbya TaxID=2650499 RepID=UPI003D3236C8
MFRLTFLLQFGSIDGLDQLYRTLANLPAAIDGTIAFVMLFLSIYIGLVSILPLEEPALIRISIVNLTFFIIVGVVLQILLNRTTLNGVLASGIIRDFIILALSIMFARTSWIGLLLLVGYVYIWGLPDAMARCGNGCPFEPLEPYFRRLY